MSYQELFNIINDNTARPDEVDDAIMYLADFPQEEVINFLINITNNDLEDYMLSSVGVSLGHIFNNDKTFYAKYRTKVEILPSIVQKEIRAILKI